MSTRTLVGYERKHTQGGKIDKGEPMSKEGKKKSRQKNKKQTKLMLIYFKPSSYQFI